MILNEGREPGAGSIGLSRQNTALGILVLLLFAFALRVSAAQFLPNLYYPDEIFQTQEPAHHIAYGYGVESWEFRDGARSLVFPAVLAGVMRATAWMGSGSDGYQLGIVLFLSSLSLIVVWFGISWGYQLGGMPAAIAAGLACALWYELIYYGPKSFNEFVAGHILLGGICLAGSEYSGENSRWWRLFLVGILCGLVVGLRMHLSPAVLVVLVYACRIQPRKKLLAVGIGLSLAILLFGLADAIKWSYPFQSYVVNFTYNVIQDKANPRPWYSLIESLFLRTGPLPLLAIWGGRRSPFLSLVALAVLVPHSFIHHKEYRFIYPMLPILVVLAVLGLLDLFAKLNGRLKTPLSTSAVAAAAVAFFCLLSVGIGSQFPFWHERTGILRALNSLSHDDHLCGLAMEQHNWAYSGGYSHLHRQVPIFLIPDIASHQPQPEIYNEIIVEKPLADIPSGFQPSQCWPGACLYHRTGNCAPGGQELEINAALKRIGQ